MDESSVLGKLMGLDELPPRQYTRKHRRVLSENYLHRVTFIGVQEKPVFTEHASFRMRLDEQKEFKNLFQPEEIFESELRCHLTAKKPKTASSLSRADLGIMRQNGSEILFYRMPQTSPECADFMEHVRQRRGSHLIPQRHRRSFFDSSSKLKDRKAESSEKSGRTVTRKFNLHQNMEFGYFHGSRVNSELCQFSRPIFESNENASLSSRRIAFQKPKSNYDFSKNATRFRSSTSCAEGFHSDSKTKNMSSKSNEKPNAGYKQSKNGGHKMESIKQTSRLSRENPYWMRKKTRHVSGSSYDSTVIERPRNQNRLEVIKGSWFLKKHESDAWQQHNFSRKRSNRTDQPRSSRNNFVEIDLSDRAYQSLNSRFYCSNTLCSRIKLEKWAMKKSQKNEPNAYNLFEGNSTLLKSSCVEPQERNHEHEPVACIFSGEDDSSSYLSNTLIQQAEASTGFQEEGSVISHCSDTVPESLVSLDEAYQSSPVSVLQPLCKEEASSGSQSMKNVGVNVGDLRLQLELLVSEPGMNVSTDEDSEGGGSVQKFDQNEEVMSFLKTDDSRDFAYLVDVLTEVCLHGKSLDLGFGNWDSLECPISISVFETLEKKFGEQMGWKRSERRLLFDRINSGLVEILQSLVCVPKWAKPVSRRFRKWPSQEALEDELWDWIDDQRKEMSKDLQKSLSLGLWKMDIGENIDAICRELVRSMTDELAVEFVGFWFTNS